MVSNSDRDEEKEVEENLSKSWVAFDDWTTRYLTCLFMSHAYRGFVATGSRGSTEPVNTSRRVVEPVNFWSNSV